MSLWIDPKPSDISISEDGKELEIYVCHDSSGAVYAILQIDYLKKLLN